MADARDRVAATRVAASRCSRRGSVAVVGAGRSAGGIGNATLQSIVECGFTGGLYAVNPNATEIRGVPCYPSVSAIPDQVDLVVIAVPAGRGRPTC